MSSHTPEKTGLSYRDAGVDIDAGDELVERIKPAVARTRRPEVLTGLGGFGALFALDLQRWREPLLVSGTDGVGTKLLLARQLDRHDTIGIDLVAMCVNDILTCGATHGYFPLLAVNEESLYAQLSMAVRTHQRILGRLGIRK